MAQYSFDRPIVKNMKCLMHEMKELNACFKHQMMFSLNCRNYFYKIVLTW